MIPEPTRHEVVVSDSHLVASHMVIPTRNLRVRITMPISAPCTVIEKDPPVPRLTFLIELKRDKSKESI